MQSDVQYTYLVMRLLLPLISSMCLCLVLGLPLDLAIDLLLCEGEASTRRSIVGMVVVGGVTVRGVVWFRLVGGAVGDVVEGRLGGDVAVRDGFWRGGLLSWARGI